MSKEAMKLALEVLKINLTLLKKINPYKGQEDLLSDSLGLTNKAITTLETELAKPDFWEGYVPELDKRQQALDKKAENARELGLDYELPITMQEGEFDCTHAERLCAELKAAHPVTSCTHPDLGISSLREDGTAARWGCVMCGTEFVPKAKKRWAEFNEITKRNIEHAEWYLSTHSQPAQQQEPVAWRYALDASVEGPRWIYIDKDPHEWLKETSMVNAVIEFLYSSPPPQRTWVGLNDDELADFWFKQSLDWMEFARVIEDALRSKNT